MKFPIEIIHFAVIFFERVEIYEGESMPASLIDRQGERAESAQAGKETEDHGA